MGVPKLLDRRSHSAHRGSGAISRRAYQRGVTMTDQARGRPRVFLVCTTDAMPTAEALRLHLIEAADVTLWSDQADDAPPRAPGAMMAELLRQARLHDFLVLVLGSGHLVARGRAPREAVPFEAGLLIGALGGERSLVALAPGTAAGS